jgi:hypothetical protein
MCETINTKGSGTADHGMIDGNAFINSQKTWPESVTYCTVDKDGNVKHLDPKTALRFYDNKNNGKYSNNATDNNNPITKLVIARTMDMEFAHYYGVMKPTFPLKVNQSWWGEGEEIGQVKETETLAVTNPLRLFPLFSYDPRRFWRCGPPPAWRQNMFSSTDRDMWEYPFSHIVGSGVETQNSIWLGFCMNPFFGFRPFDELYDYLPQFYEECNAKNIPILAHCSPDGFIAHNARYYYDFDVNVYLDRIKKNKARHGNMLCSNDYCGREHVVDRDIDMDHFYRNYGHPRNWIPVLKHCNDLRLCLAHFGGNSEWGRESMNGWGRIKNARDAKNANSLPIREWISCIIKLTKYYKNVYADISGLDIEKSNIKDNFQGMLRVICEQEEFWHLKYKLIFGSNRYFTGVNGTNDYNAYCNKFKALFGKIGEKGEELWKHVSLFNPWNFYGLSLAKFKAIHAALPQLAEKLPVNFLKNKADAMLKKCGELEKHIPPFQYNPAEYVKKDNDLEPMAGSASCGRSKEDVTCENCGLAYRGEISCVKNKTTNKYGPRYLGKLPLEKYDKWDELIRKKILAENEKNIIIGVSANEGNLDTVHSYDSEIVSVGVMQKTIDQEGFGQFPIQMAKFKGTNGQKFKTLFENCGWTFKKENRQYRAYYRDITGANLKEQIRNGFTKEKHNYIVPCIPIEPLINAIKDPEFQALQIEDFVLALREVLNIYPIGHSNMLCDYLTSILGRAMVLDQYVNRPSYVLKDFGDALNKFYMNSDAASRDPKKWGKDHERYEKEVIGYYADLRRGSDMGKRYDKLLASLKLK